MSVNNEDNRMTNEMVNTLPSYSQQFLYRGAASHLLNPSNDSDTAWAKYGSPVRVVLRFVHAVAVLIFSMIEAHYHIAMDLGCNGMAALGRRLPKSIDTEKWEQRVKDHRAAALGAVATMIPFGATYGIGLYAYALGGSKAIAYVARMAISASSKELGDTAYERLLERHGENGSHSTRLVDHIAKGAVSVVGKIRDLLFDASQWIDRTVLTPVALKVATVWTAFIDGAVILSIQVSLKIDALWRAIDDAYSTRWPSNRQPAVVGGQ
jgi:hypothetical protein